MADPVLDRLLAELEALRAIARRADPARPVARQALDRLNALVDEARGLMGPGWSPPPAARQALAARGECSRHRFLEAMGALMQAVQRPVDVGGRTRPEAGERA
jgi:hypothetical protein